MATRQKVGAGILAEENAAKREAIVELLTRAYWMEMETVMSYLANAAHLDGIRADEIAEALASDVDEELGHARTFAERIKELYGTPPGSMEFTAEQSYLQPPGRRRPTSSPSSTASSRPRPARSSTTCGSSRPATASTGPPRTWSSRSCATRRATCAPSSATGASSSSAMAHAPRPSRTRPAPISSAVEARYLLAMFDLERVGRHADAGRGRAQPRRVGPDGARDDPPPARLGFVEPDAIALTHAGQSAALVLSSRRAAAHALVHDVLGVEDEQSRAARPTTSPPPCPPRSAGACWPSASARPGRRA